ncbi:cytochrome c oxidase assembly protein [Aquisalimonas lutea]|uniref:cytochrome c oxidase assembly protein n=1 Tax=Aquisalimonas lutea TaxID=1327750 RepID=UPI0025B2F84A|nr:cytochrome c oxidase assembly protein [Aquisalimonas lutea]MDN3519099.1 cytochrome c oxidase assembly protein [Aquisalimonas lutea]
MPEPSDIVHALTPYQWQPMVTLVCGLVFLLYLRGLGRGGGPGFWRNTAFFVGLGLMYGVSQTQFDYFSQYVFFIHRIQHLALHHVAAMLLVLANPLPVLAQGAPAWLRDNLITPVWRSGPVRGAYGAVQQPVVAAFLFVGLIYLWLTPSIHFDAMLSGWLYSIMNWSMALDGLLFWWLVLNPYPPDPAQHRIGYGKRCIVVAVVAFPQIVLGAYIFFYGTGVYEYYEVCGSPWPIDTDTDRMLGGLITWIPSAMMSVLGLLIVLSQMFRQEKREAERMGRDAAASGSTA